MRERIFTWVGWAGVCRTAMVALILGSAWSASAATYTLPASIGVAGTPFSSCHLASGSTYTCSSLTLAAGDIVLLTSSLTLNVSGNQFTIGNNVQINNNGSGFTILITATEDSRIGTGFVGTVSFQTLTKEIQVGAGSTITGNLTANSLVIANTVVVNGTCIPSNARCTGGGSVSVPTVTTVAASSVSATGATINGSVSSNGASTTVTFDYGTTVSYGSAATASQSPLASGASGTAVSAVLSGLACGTTYNFRVKGVNSAGTSVGSNLTFATSACASSYSAYETAISNASAGTASATARYIKTRVASSSGSLCQQDGITCSLTVAAFNASNAVLTTDSSSVAASLEYCSNVSRAASVTCGGSWSALAAAGTQNLTLANGVGTLTFPFVNNAYEVVRVKLVAGAMTSYSNDYFAIRPNALTIAASDSNVSSPGTTSSLTSGLYTHQAGEPFTLKATATIKTSGATASNYPGGGSGPVSKTVTTTTPASGAVNGTVTPGAWSASGGTLTSNSATYSEVGTFTLTLEDRSYADVDVSDGQSSTSDRYFSGSVVNVGRFTPDHFKTALTQGCAAGAFTYSGQPFSAVITAVTSAATGETTTLNYFGVGGAQTVTLSNAGVTTGFGGNVISNASFVINPFTATPAYTFASATTAPATLTLRATDTDGITSSGYTEGTATIFSGRLRLANAYGSELLALNIPTYVEYFASAALGWQTNAFDTSCSTVTAANFAFNFPASNANYTNNLAACRTVVSVSGTPPTPVVKLSAPGVGFTGWSDLTLNLGASAAGSTCNAPVSAAFTGPATTANMPWLQFNWSGSSGNPKARAFFGVRKPGPTILQRELF